MHKRWPWEPFDGTHAPAANTRALRGYPALTASNVGLSVVSRSELSTKTRVGWRQFFGRDHSRYNLNIWD